jgi:hypothetical protein
MEEILPEEPMSLFAPKLTYELNDICVSESLLYLANILGIKLHLMAGSYLFNDAVITSWISQHPVPL